MKAADIMDAPGPSVTPETPVVEAVRKMLEHKVSGLPVVDEEGRLVGMITEGDLLRRSELGTERKITGFAAVQAGTRRLAEEFVRAHAQTIGDVMTKEPVSIDEETAIATIVSLIEDRHLHLIPVVRKGSLVGMIGRPCLLRALIERAEAQEDNPTDDESIRTALLAVYDREAWAPLSQVDVMVRNGNVELRGNVTDPVKRRALVVAAQAIAGVKSVTDHLSPQSRGKAKTRDDDGQ
ncbi:MAG: CBS domain-containing protein [Rhizobiales bacterium]|nr:CBS domain-containing protein [Hyphomicrobiales bacterium]